MPQVWPNTNIGKEKIRVEFSELVALIGGNEIKRQNEMLILVTLEQRALKQKGWKREWAQLLMHRVNKI